MTADPHNHNAHPHILLVEDEAITALTEKRTLQGHGYEVTVAHSGEEAIQSVTRDSGIALVLMDIDLGDGIDGTQAADSILRERSLPIVFLTGHAEKEYVSRVRSITSYGYVLKDAGEFVLAESIRMALQLFRANERAKEREHQLQESERRYRELFEHAPIGIFQTHSTGRVLSVNPMMAYMVGASSPEQAIEYYSDLANQLYVHSERRDEFVRLLAERGRVEGFEYGARRLDGKERVFTMNARMHFSDSDGTFTIDGFTADITERKAAERTAAEREEDLRTTLESIGDGVITTDLECRIHRMNPVAERLTGVTSREARGSPLEQVFHIVNANTRETVENPVHKVIATGRTFELTKDTMLISRDGTEYHLADSAAPIRDRDNTLTGVVMVFRDSTEEYESRRKLREGEQEYRTLFHSIRDAILVADTDRNIINCNQAFTDMFGYTLDEIGGKQTSSLYAYQSECEEMGAYLRQLQDAS
ncbi:MAG: PAS domain S-box protein, partial [Spirochaetia bacterium]